MNHVLRFPAILLAAWFCLGALVCPRVQGEDPSPPPIRVGVLHSLSGTMKVSEESLVDAIRMAIDEINARGGVLGRRLEPVIEDGQSDWPTFARKAEKLITEDQVVSVFGCWTSASRKAVLPVFEEHDHLLWYPVQYEGQERSPNIIYTGAAPNQQITPAVLWCRREFGPRMFLVGSDYVFPRTANEIINYRLAALGAESVGEEYQPLGSQDFDEIVARIKQAQPDVILNTINGDSNLAFFRALRKAGITHRQIPVMSFSVAEDELRYIGVDLTEGHYCCWNYFQSIDTPANRRFVREFQRRYGAERVTDDPIEAAYFQVHMFAKAVEKAGSVDIAAIRQAARGLIFAAPGGLVRIDPRNQHTWKVSRIGRIQESGQFKIVWSSKDPLRPQPFLPESFIAKGAQHGGIIFTRISEMISLEAEQPADRERKRLFATLSDVRGFLGDARAKFRSAVLLTHQQHRIDFEESWREFELRLRALHSQKALLTEKQLQALEKIDTARVAFEKNATFMFEALYPPRSKAEVTP